MKGLAAISIIIIVSAVFVNGQTRSRRPKAATPGPAPKFQCLNRVERAQWQILLDDVKKTNPERWQRLHDDPKLLTLQAENLREMLALACHGLNHGLGADPLIIGELENIKMESRANDYDTHINADKAASGQFSLISADQVSTFYAKAGNLLRFDEFLKIKTAMLERSSGLSKREITEEEKTAAKDIFARIAIYDDEVRLKQRSLGPAFIARLTFRQKLQQSQFLSKTYADTLKDRLMVTDAEIDAYIGAHPEFDLAGKEAKARGLLVRAKAGEDFAALANEFTDDPGNVGADGTKNGGLYANVPKGVMVAPFEKAALSLQPGALYQDLVPSDFGYHIIKLDRKDETKSADGTVELKYDVRHILISTMQKDMAGPTPRDLPIRAFVRIHLENEKEGLLKKEVLAANPIVIAHIDTPVAATGKRPVKRRN